MGQILCSLQVLLSDTGWTTHCLAIFDRIYGGNHDFQKLHPGHGHVHQCNDKALQIPPYKEIVNFPLLPSVHHGKQIWPCPRLNGSDVSVPVGSSASVVPGYRALVLVPAGLPFFSFGVKWACPRMLSLDVVAGMVGAGCSLAECSRIQSVLWSDGAVGLGSEEGAAVRRQEEYAAFGQGHDCKSRELWSLLSLGRWLLIAQIEVVAGSLELA
jgi:hypothetical protein